MHTTLHVCVCLCVCVCVCVCLCVYACLSVMVLLCLKPISVGTNVYKKNMIQVTNFQSPIKYYALRRCGQCRMEGVLLQKSVVCGCEWIMFIISGYVRLSENEIVRTYVRKPIFECIYLGILVSVLAIRRLYWHDAGYKRIIIR